ncbi:hypothetical protein QWZ08_26890 [Ferruginibacter paludis]|uniref:hypothetical protein n=1 Tax=Ferruginibacter paludis TaxID=1310417 RepID=UPI0025B2ACFA|nr:hypothetical protein [Ferruginibacter paludis]MDN3659301.1 hypothetical protein [Ferruginibacter paludis]
MNQELHIYLQQTFQLPATINEMEQVENYLAEKINSLIKNNFDQLVYLLYRVDVDEARLKTVLKENPQQDAGKIIARLLIERQLQKITLRKQFTKKEDGTNEEEKW